MGWREKNSAPSNNIGEKIKFKGGSLRTSGSVTLRVTPFLTGKRGEKVHVLIGIRRWRKKSSEKLN